MAKVDPGVRRADASATLVTRARAGVLLVVAGNGLVLLGLASEKLGLAGSTVFGWKQVTAVLVGVTMGSTGAVALALPVVRAEAASVGRRLSTNVLELAALCALAISQPLFDLLADDAEFFVARQAPAGDIVVLVVALLTVPPGILLAIEALAGRVNIRAQQILHVLIVGGLAGLLLLNALSEVQSIPAGVILALATYAGIAAALAYVSLHGARLVVRVLAATPFLFGLLFLLSPGVSAIVFGDEADGRSAGSASDAPVVMIVFDEFPTTMLLSAPQRIDARRYPNFARLARTATWYPNATAVSDMTTRAVPAILTGEFPRAGTVPTASEHPDNLFTLLDRSHRMQVREEVTQLCTERVCGERAAQPFPDRMRSLAEDMSVIYRRLVLPEGLREGLPDITTGFRQFEAPFDGQERVLAALEADRTALFESFLSEIQPGEKPTLHFLHLLLPHVQFEFLPSGRRYGGAAYMPGIDEAGKWLGDEPTRFLLHQRALLQLGYVDRLVGHLIGRLEETGLFDDALVVLVADHGAAMLEGDERRRLTDSNIGGILPVPLFVKAPQQRDGRTVDAHVRTVDVLPTIARLLDARVPWATDGRPLVGGPYPDRTRLRFLRDVEQDEISISVESLERERAKVLSRQLGLFGAGNPFPGRAGLHGHHPLLDRRLAEIPMRTGGPRAAIDSPEAYEDVATGDPVLPVYVTGHLENVPAGSHRDIAVAVNTRVVAIARTFAVDDRESFGVMIPPWSLRDGSNDVRVLAIASDGGETILEAP
ncbi:MAG: sulfatase-like hydrolase/transferase [Acidimicrobiia bacterium]